MHTRAVGRRAAARNASVTVIHGRTVRQPALLHVPQQGYAATVSASQALLHTFLHQQARRALTCRAVQQVAGEANTAATSTSGSAITAGDAWAAFSKAVTGEWEASTVTFSASGEAQELPQHYVPGAFRDWGVQLFDWQSSTSMTATQARMPLRPSCVRLRIIVCACSLQKLNLYRVR